MTGYRSLINCDRLRRSTTRARKTTLKACVLRLSFSVRKYYLFIARERFSATTNPGETVADRDNNNRRRIVCYAFFFLSFFLLSPLFFLLFVSYLRLFLFRSISQATLYRRTRPTPPVI